MVDRDEPSPTRTTERASPSRSFPEEDRVPSAMWYWNEVAATGLVKHEPWATLFLPGPVRLD